MSLPKDHGVVQLTTLLNALDGKVVRIDAERTTAAENDADFDRRVRKSLDRQHRRNVIAQG